MRYVVYNPIRAGLVTQARDYRWNWSESESEDEVFAGAVPGEWCLRRVAQVGAGKVFGGDEENGITEDEYTQAKAIVIEANRASASMLQLRMHIGYNHASRMIDLLERRGVIGPHRGAGPREIIAS